MTRSAHLIIQILRFIERFDDNCISREEVMVGFPSTRSKLTNYHITLLCNAGFLEPLYDNKTGAEIALRMTWAGHDYLDKSSL